MFKLLLLVLAALSVPAALKAEIARGRSLEWLADTSVCIGIYRTVSIAGKKPGSDNIVSCQMMEALKGTAPAVATFDFFPRRRDAQGYFRPAPLTLEDRFLIFFRNDESGRLKPTHHIILSQPLTGGERGLAINDKFEVIADSDRILRIVKERLSIKPSAKVLPMDGDPSIQLDLDTKKPTSPQVNVQVPWSSPAHDQLWSGSVCYLLIPEDLLPKP